jgi:hypothetical protein
MIEPSPRSIFSSKSTVCHSLNLIKIPLFMKSWKNNKSIPLPVTKMLDPEI